MAMTRALEGRTALVTGGSRGIGRAVVERLARDGASVVFSFVRHKQAADDVAESVRAAGGVAHAVQADLANAPYDDSSPPPSICWTVSTSSSATPRPAAWAVSPT
jgi:NAD(P)-dependent dehydrogenase (short-subunit alcohol dehydrogenase family)